MDTLSNRWCLPFTGNIDIEMITLFLQLAASSHVQIIAVVLLSLTHAAHGGYKKIRAEYVEQAWDFRAIVQQEARKLEVPVIYHEIMTSNSIATLQALPTTLNCDRLLLGIKQQRSVLLQPHETQALLASDHVPLLVTWYQKPHTTTKWWQRLWPRSHQPGLQNTAYTDG